jgi:hypothetical protein
MPYLKKSAPRAGLWCRSKSSQVASRKRSVERQSRSQEVCSFTHPSEVVSDSLRHVLSRNTNFIHVVDSEATAPADTISAMGLRDDAQKLRETTMLRYVTALALALSLAACGSSKSPEGNEPTPTPVIGESTAATTSPSNEQSTIAIPSQAGNVMAIRNGLLSWGCLEGGSQSTDSANRSADGQQQSFVQTTSDASRKSVPTLIVNGFNYTRVAPCAVAGSEQGPRLVYAAEEDKPSSGLSPASKQVVLHAYVPGAAAEYARRTVSEQPDEFDNVKMFGTPDGVLVETWTGSGFPTVQQFSASNLQAGWKKEGELIATAGETAAILLPAEGYTRYGSLQGPGRRLAIVRTSDGSELASYDQVSLAHKPTAVYNDGYVFAVDHSDRTIPDSMVWIDGKTGRATTPFNGATNIEPDPFGPLLLIQRGLSNETSYDVVDRTDGSVKFSVGAEQVRGLAIQEIAIDNGRLYILNRSDSPVVDALTGEKLASGWSHRPVARTENATVVANDSSSDDSGKSCLTSGYDTELDFNFLFSLRSAFTIGDAYRCGGYTIYPDDNGEYTGPFH